MPLTTQQISDAQLAAVSTLLKLWRNNANDVAREIIKGINPARLLPKAERALSKVKAANVIRFDPYIVCGHDPSENQISNALKVIFDPRGSHGLGFIGLTALFDAIETDDPSFKRKINAIQAALKHPTVNADIVREFHLDTGRVDFRIDIRAGDTKFIIFVENKKGVNPQEIGAIPQTVRYEQILENEEKAGVVGLGIYLTPTGKAAASKLFVPLSSDQFAASLRRKLSATEAKISDDAASLILVYAFALTYAWTN